MRTTAIAIVAAGAFILLSMRLFGAGDLPSTDAIRTAAGQAQDIDAYCLSLRAKIQLPPPILRDEAMRRIDAAKAAASTAVLDLRNANLHGAKLDGAILRSAMMQFADLTEASIEGASFADADLSCANLTLAHGKASFRGAVLKGATLANADLRNSSLALAHLDPANLASTILTKADLGGAWLIGAHIVGTDLDKATLSGADLKFADYRAFGTPRAGDLQNLVWVFPQSDEFSGLAILRKALVDEGDNTRARIVTYAIESWRDDYRRAAAHAAGCISGSLDRLVTGMRWLLFDWTVAYGAAPSRAVVIFVWTGGLFALLYLSLIRLSHRTGRWGGLYRVQPTGRLVLGATITEAADARIERVPASLRVAVRAALCFSVLSSSRFEFGSFTLGSWLAVLQPDEVEYRSLGCVRVLSGLQALIGFYLLVLFAITLFADPFSLWP
jgi:uncharacterized protein YjbI with pentapeptide repeats